MDPSDYVELYKVVDSGSEILIHSIHNTIEKQTFKGNASGKSLVLVIRAKVTTADEFYHLDNLSVSYSEQ